MTISTTTSSTIAHGNGSTTVFSFDFPCTAAAYLRVVYTDADGVETPIDASQYTVTGIGNPTGGTVTYPLSGSPIATGTFLTMSREVPLTQQTSFVNQSGFYPDVLEAALDLLTMEIQQVYATALSGAASGGGSGYLPISFRTQLAASNGASLVGFGSDSLYAFLQKGTANQVVIGSGAGSNCVWGQVATGMIANTAVTSAKLYNGAATLDKLDRTGTVGKVLTSNGAGVAPSWNSLQYNYGVRQTVQYGSVSATTGLPNFITTGSGLQPLLSATSTNVRIAFANGVADYIETISADTSFPAVAINNLSFLRVTRTGDGAVSLDSTLAPPQYGYAYNAALQCNLTLNNVSTDDFGNTFTNANVTFSNSSPKYAGTYYGVFNGTSAKLTSTSFTNPLTILSGWTVRFGFYATNIATTQGLLGLINAGGYGLTFALASSKLVIAASSNGTTTNVINSVSSTSTLSSATWYDVEVCQDNVAGKIYAYINGTADSAFTTSSTASLCPITTVEVGVSNSAGSNYFAGNMTALEIKPYCAHPAGVTFTPQTALSTITTAGYASDFFSIQLMTMYSISAASSVAGTLPTFTSKNCCYVGEATSTAYAVSSVVNYAINGKYDSGLFAVAAANTYTKSHNLGSQQFALDITMADDLQGTNERPVAIVLASTGYYAGASTRNSAAVVTCTTYVGYTTAGSAASTSNYRIRARRIF